jgi:DNA-binding HxlR family transcriptional regulator
VVYSLTPAAVDLLARARSVVDWAEANAELFEQLRAAQVDTNGTPVMPSDDASDDDLQE